MAGFVFRLQSLLDLKRNIEEDIKLKFGMAVKELERNKSILKSIEKEKYANMEEFTQKASKKLFVIELMEYSKYISYLNQKAEIQKENVKKAEDYVDKIREELVKAAKEREMLERLREKRYEKFLREQQQNEQKLSDEIYSIKYVSLGRAEK
jgi:flagellar FliJ protein